jgi:hypothetical protein
MWSCVAIATIICRVEEAQGIRLSTGPHKKIATVSLSGEFLVLSYSSSTKNSKLKTQNCRLFTF